MIINDLVQPVLGKLRNRTDLLPNIPYWIAQVLLDLSENYEYEALKVTGPQTAFVPGIAEYPLQGFDPQGITGNPFVGAPQHKITFIETLFVYYAPTGAVTVGQTTGFEMNNRHIRVVEPMSKILGIPSVYCLHGDKRWGGVLIVGMMPDNPYPCQMRYQREHPFNLSYEQVLLSYNNPANSSKIAASTIYLPNDWTDIIVYAAAEKACDDAGLTEIGQLYHSKLYGYKDKRGNETPGLIMVRMTQQERQTINNSRQMRPVVRRYT